MTYGKSISLNRTSAYQRNRNVISMSTSKRGMGPISSIIILVLVLCLLGLMYLTQVTKTNALGYKLSELNIKESQLKEEYASLEVESTKLQNLDRVKSSSVASSMVDTKPTAFISH